MNVVLVTHDSVFGRHFAATLADAGCVDRIFVETQRAPLRFYGRKLRRVGPIDFAFQYWLNRWFEREGRRALPDLPMPAHERIPSINTLTFMPDELVVGFGTSYVSATTLAGAPNGILNVHTGVLPQYRGVKSEFWALHNGETDHLGWTLHYMTSQLDAGDIVLRGTVPWHGESPGLVRARLVRDAAPAIATFLASRKADPSAETRVPQDAAAGHYYTTPTWREWRQTRRMW